MRYYELSRKGFTIFIRIYERKPCRVPSFSPSPSPIVSFSLYTVFSCLIITLVPALYHVSSSLLFSHFHFLSAKTLRRGPCMTNFFAFVVKKYLCQIQTFLKLKKFPQVLSWEGSNETSCAKFLIIVIEICQL